MRIIEIIAAENGAHQTQTSDRVFPVPQGWAVIPDDMEIPDTFPFVNIEVEGQTVTSITAGEVPELPPEPTPEPTADAAIYDEMAAAYTEGVNIV